MTKTYKKWRKWFDKKYKEKHQANHTSWAGITKFYRMTEKALGHPDVKEDEFKMMVHRLTNPLTGLTEVVHRMSVWYNTLDNIREVCVKPDNSLYRCPDDPEAYGMSRLLYTHQDSYLLLLTLLMLHETAYKGVVDFVYDTNPDKQINRDKTKTKQRAKYLVDQGFDVMSTTDHFLRNAIAHSSFVVRPDGSVLAFDVKEPSLDQPSVTLTSLSPGIKCYTYQVLIKEFEKHQSLIAEAAAGVTYWFHVNYGMQRLFDDRFFGSPERDDVREAAWDEIERSNMLDWRLIRDRFGKMLPDEDNC